jgi:3-hydroxyacyl-CoA dehydrogenase
MNIKIIGSGSAGNHMAFALEKFAKTITMSDISKKALNDKMSLVMEYELDTISLIKKRISEILI